MRTIFVVDTETTGLESEDVPIEVAIVRVDIEEQQQHKSVGRIIAAGQSFVSPGSRPIHPNAKATHHIIEDQLAGAPSLIVAVATLSVDLLEPETPHIIVAHNAEYDRAMLKGTTLSGDRWLCTWRLAHHIWPEAPGFSNGTLRYWLSPNGGLPDVADLGYNPLSIPSHRAIGDALVTAQLLIWMLRERTLSELIALNPIPILLSTIRFGKYKGQAFRDLPTGYLQWITKVLDFDEDTRHTALYYLFQRSAERERIKAAYEKVISE